MTVAVAEVRRGPARSCGRAQPLGPYKLAAGRHAGRGRGRPQALQAQGSRSESGFTSTPTRPTLITAASHSTRASISRANNNNAKPKDAGVNNNRRDRNERRTAGGRQGERLGRQAG